MEYSRFTNSTTDLSAGFVGRCNLLATSLVGLSFDLLLGNFSIEDFVRYPKKLEGRSIGLEKESLHTGMLARRRLANTAAIIP